jgi:hypothetical protein
MAEEVARLPAVSRAIATILFAPLDVAVVFHVTEYGADVSSEPIVVPFALNVTPATATLSEALADSTTEPPTVAPLAGAVTETVGAVLSTVTEIEEEVA